METDHQNNDGQQPTSQLAQTAGLGAMDDDFEEFPVQANALQDGGEQQEPVSLWEDNWDDDNAAAETEFDKQLREELEKHGH